MKKLVSGAFICWVVVSGLAAPALASTCAFDPVPAATLLFPFVVFDYNHPFDGVTTLFAITNLSPESQIVRVTLWSDLGVPVLGFNIVLSGYDVQTVNIRDILYFGHLPSTGTAGDLEVSPNLEPNPAGPVAGDIAPWVALEPGQGTGSLLDRCPPTAVGYPDYPTLTVEYLDALHALLAASQTAPRGHEDCSGNPTDLPMEDWFQSRTLLDPTWMWVTADVVWSCGLDLPNDVGYWRAPVNGGQAQYQNVLIGDVFWVGGLFAAEDRAVHLEADPDLATVAAVDDAGAPVSFYYRFSTAAAAGADLREPLPTAWALRYVGWHSTLMDTWVRVFKSPTFGSSLPDLVVSDETAPTSLSARDCLAYTYFAWDEDENVTTEIPCDWPPCLDMVQTNLFPLVTQEVNIDQLDLVDVNGWVLFLWPPSNWAGSDQPLPDRYQTWMGVKHDAYGVFTGATTAIVAGNANCLSE